MMPPSTLMILPGSSDPALGCRSPRPTRRPNATREPRTCPVRLALFEECGDTLLRVGHQRVHRHNVAGMFIGRVLVGFDLRVERALADAADQRTRIYDLFG